MAQDGMTISVLVLASLGAVGLTAGFVDTIAGGGGLLTVPSLLLAGLPPVAALATNKLQSSSGTATASLTLIAKRQVLFEELPLPFAASFTGSLLGCLLVQHIGSQSLNVVIPAVLGGIALYYLWNRQAGLHAGPSRLSQVAYSASIIPIIGFYDGFFGPGTGSFFGLAGVALRGQTLLRSTSQAKLLNFSSNLAALMAYLAHGHIIWLIGVVMVAGQIAGAWLGTHAMIRGGARLIRPLVVIMCLAMLARYAWQKGLFPL